MRQRESHDRTVRLLSAQLEALAVAGERAPGRERELEPYVRRAAAATRNAVELRLLTRAEANAIWAAVAKHHPGARWAGAGPRAT